MRALFISLLALATLVACQPPGGAEGEAPAADGGVDAAPRRARTVSAKTIRPQRFVEKLELTAKLEAPNDVTLSAQGAGTVKEIVELGATVSKKQVVARLDASVSNAAVAQADAAIAQAQAQLALAQENHRRQKPLAEKGIISALEFQSIEARLNQARAGLKQARAGRRAARTQVDFTRVIAPSAGVVEQRFVEAGEQLNPGQPVLRIVDTRVVEVVAGVPERFATEVRPGVDLEVGFNAYGVPDHQAKVTFVGRTIDPRSRTFTIKAELPNPKGLLKPEMIAKVRLTRSAVVGALVVPQTAVLRDERGASVVLAVDGKDGLEAKRTRVELGVASGNEVVVSKGIGPGAKVVIMGQQGLSTGDAIKLGSEGAKAPAAPVKKAAAR